MQFPRMMGLIALLITANAQADSRLTVFNLLPDHQSISISNESHAFSVDVESFRSSGYLVIPAGRYDLTSVVDGESQSSELELADGLDFSAMLGRDPEGSVGFFFSRDHNYPLGTLSVQWSNLVSTSSVSQIAIRTECIANGALLFRGGSGPSFFGDGTFSAHRAQPQLRLLFPQTAGAECYLTAETDQGITVSEPIPVRDSLGHVYRLFLVGDSPASLRFVTYLQELREVRGTALLGDFSDRSEVFYPDDLSGRGLALMPNANPNTRPTASPDVHTFNMMLFDYDDDGQPTWSIGEFQGHDAQELQSFVLYQARRTESGVFARAASSLTLRLYQCGPVLSTIGSEGFFFPHDADPFRAFECDAAR